MSTGGAGAGSDVGLTLITEEKRREEGVRKKQEVKDLRQGESEMCQVQKDGHSSQGRGAEAASGRESSRTGQVGSKDCES